MANTTPSPYMNMPVPTVSVDPGPDWATNYDACLSVLDGHTHIAGSGQQITPAGMNINVDLPFGGNNATALKSVRFTSQTAALSSGADLGCLYEVLNDLYFNDGVGNQIRITQSGAVTGASGTITGLPSGTASASYAAATFTFQSATNTPATMAVGPLIVGNVVANSKTVTINPNASIAANYSFILPAALPASLNYLTLDSSGNVSYNSSGSTGSGAMVLATSPTITTPSISTATFTGLTTVSVSGIAFSSGTLTDYVESTWTPTYTNISQSSNYVLVFAKYQKIGNVVFCNINCITDNAAGGARFSLTLPLAPNNNFSATGNVNGINVGPGGIGTVTAIVSSKLIQIFTPINLTGAGIQGGISFQYYINN